jgi:hypothetical protein
MNMECTFVISDHVVARSVGAETVILDLAHGTYFGLDPVGARIWELIAAGKPLVEICGLMMEEYDVAREVLECDALELVRDLANKELIRVQ